MNNNTKWVILLLLGMSPTVGIYSDTGRVHLSNMTDAFIAKATEQKGKNTAKKILRKAEKLYNKAVKNYNGGNRKKANKYYHKALELLQLIDIDMVMECQSGQEFNTLFTKLGRFMDKKDSSEVYLKNKYTIPMDVDNKLVKKYMKIYTTGISKKRVKEALERSGKYREMILEILREYNLPDELVYLPVVESLYKNNARSRAGAVGLWQLMKHRARALDLKVNFWIDERKDPEKATRAAARYLKDLHIMFDDWHLALAAYNRGEYGLGRDIAFAKAVNINQMSERMAVPRETARFVPQFIVSVLIGDNHKEFGFNIKYDKQLEYDVVTVNNVIDLNIVAECANTTLERIKELNPELKTWCTPHKYVNFKLKLPVGSKDGYIRNIAKVEDLNPGRGTIKYKVVKGDCLDKIARKFCTTARTLRAENKLEEGSLIKINQKLLIRPGRKYFVRN